MAEIWERQKGESSKAYAAFCIYRDLGPDRSLDKALAAANKKPTNRRHWSRWMEKYNWYERVQVYDDYIDRKKRDEKEKAILEMSERQAREAMALQQKGLEMLRSLCVEEGKWQDAWRLIVEGAKLERLAMGEPTEIGKQEVTLPAIVEVITGEKDTDTTAPGAEQGLEE